MLDISKMMFISPQGLKILVFRFLCVFVTLLLPGFQACVYAEGRGGGGGGNGYLNVSKFCPFGGCYGLLSFFLFNLDEGASYCCAYLFH